MKRPLLNLLAALALLLVAATAALWARSYWYWDSVSYSATPTLRWRLESQRGRIQLQRAQAPAGYSAPAGWSLDSGPVDALLGEPVFTDRHRWSHLGIEWDSIRDPVRHAGASIELFEFDSLFLPNWLLSLLEALLPAVWLMRRRRSRPHHTGLCSACGYDLRASIHRCPECGTLIPLHTEPQP